MKEDRGHWKTNEAWKLRIDAGRTDEGTSRRTRTPTDAWTASTYRMYAMAPEAYVQVVKLALAAELEVESTVGEVQEDVVAGNAHTGAGDKLSSGCLRVLEMIGTGRPSPLARAFSIYFNILDYVGWLV
ncbi:hypothetical protein PI124_g18843 [Phytophthora idaei]|nr:hypothetical protein PI124_g18843 [Phytophthora idaei]